MLMRLSGTGIACTRGGREIFANLNFTVGSGELLMVTGPNGAGKTTLLRVMAGLLRLSAGRLSLQPCEEDARLGEQVHYLGHQDALKPSLTVLENLLFWARYFGATAPPLNALSAVGLERLAKLPAAYLSAGQRRRLSMARLIAIQRPIWLLDEPTAVLDTAAQAKLTQLMHQHRGSNGIVILATHAPFAYEGARELPLGAR